MQHNPFIQYQDELAVSRDNDSRFLAKSMFWKHIELIHPKHLYRPSTVEYRTVKVMLLESILILLAAGLFTGHVALAYNKSMYKHTTVEAGYFAADLENVQTVDGIWDWLSTDFVLKIFDQQDSYANLSAVVTPPLGWLNMTATESSAYIRANGIFEVSSTNPGWTPHYLNDAPFQGAIVLGTARLRQIASKPSSDCFLGNMCYMWDTESTEDKTVLIGTPIEIVGAFNYTPGNVTQQGRFDGYSSGGYVFDFPLSQASSLYQLNILKEWGWVDPSTRALLLEFSTVNTRIKGITNAVVLIEFDGSGNIAASESFVPLWMSSRTVTSSFIVLILTFAIFVGYLLLVFWIFVQTGMYDFFSYFWNYIDLSILILFFIYIAFVQSFGTVPSILSPVFSALPASFFPFSTYQNSMTVIRQLASVLSILVWFRVFKVCLLFSGGLRTVVRVIENSVAKLVFLFARFLLGFTGLLLAWSIAFSSEFYKTNTWTSLWVLCFGGLDYSRSFFFSVDPANKPLLAVLFMGFVIVMFIALPAICLGTISNEYRKYLLFVESSKQNVESDKFALYPPGIDRSSFWHSDAIRIFAYTWYFRMKGVELIQEREEDVGSPDEQGIDLELLPKFVQQKWAQKRLELEQVMSVPKTLVERKQSVFGRAMTKGLATVYARANSIFRGRGRTMNFSATSPARDTSRITRIQLQRLLDTEPDLCELFKKTDEKWGIPYPSKIRAIDIIRKYGSREFLNRNLIFQNLLANLSGEATSPDAVKTGLNQIVIELDAAWKEQLSLIVDTCTELTLELIALKARLEKNHAVKQRP